MLQVDDGATRTENVTGLDKYTEYEFQVLAFTSNGYGPKSSVQVERTNEDGELIQYLNNIDTSVLMNGFRKSRHFHNLVLIRTKTKTTTCRVNNLVVLSGNLAHAQ